VDGAALGWTLLITIAATVLFGFAPGLRISAGNLQDTLKDSGHGMSTSRKHERLRAALVISEVTLACVLLAGAGLLLRSFLRVLDVDLGFQPSQAAAIKIDYDDHGDPAKRGAILQEILQRVSALPGIESAGIADMLPLDRNRSWGFQAKGRLYRRGEDLGAMVYVVTPGYLRTMGMQLREGRDFSWHDTAKSRRVVIINQAAARYHWPDQDSVGRIALVGGQEARVIGVISNVRESSVEEASSPEMYLPMTQAGPEGAELVVRSRLPLNALQSSVMRTLRSLNPGQPATTFRPIQEIVDHAISPRRFFVVLVSSFAALGVLLASLGIYGVMSYSVTRRKQEIGIRMALGATGPRVQFAVLADALRMAFIGVVLGTLGALAAAKWIASLLYGTKPRDPATFAAMILLLMLVALVASYIPARRASRLDPMIALRDN
jgi:predicted permease